MNKTSYRNLIAKTKEIETYLHTHQTKTMEEIEDQIKHTKIRNQFHKKVN